MLPEAFLKRMEKLLQEEYTDFVQSFEREAYKGLRVNTLKGNLEEFLAECPFSLQKIPWVDNGFYYREDEKPGRHPLHEAGAYYIQEPSAMAPVTFLDAKPGDRILDLCAAPGGKSTQIAGYMKGEGILFCNEIHPARARILSENIERMGIRNAIVTNENPKHLAGMFPGYFDKILVDAPCSGEGMFRKKEEAGEEWSEENVVLCAERQDEVLCRAADMLRPGGRLVYSTCTFAPAENEGSISRFLQTHTEFRMVKTTMPEGFVCGRKDWVPEAADNIDYTMRLMPHKVQGEGHFIAVMEKEGEKETSFKRNSINGIEKGIREKEYTDFLDFKKKYLKDSCPKNVCLEGTYLLFGEQLYLGPKDMPALKGLKVLRPGLHLGTLKKNRFEPSHALALTLKKEEAVQCVMLSAKEASVYISGQTFSGEEIEMVPADVSGGWCLVCVEGFSLGWGKLAGNQLKNHYPKGLRKG